MAHLTEPKAAVLQCLAHFAQAVATYRTTIALLDVVANPGREYLAISSSRLFDMATIEWANVFGSTSMGTHWTKVLPEDRHAQVRAQLEAACSTLVGGWTAYRDSMINYRNELGAHHAVAPTVANHPEFSLGLAAADVVHAHMREADSSNTPESSPSTLFDRQSVRVQRSLDHLLSGQARKDVQA